MKFLVLGSILLSGCSTTMTTYHRYKCQVEGFDDHGHALFSQCSPYEYPQNAEDCMYFETTKENDRDQVVEMSCTGKVPTVIKE